MTDNRKYVKRGQALIILDDPQRYEEMAGANRNNAVSRIFCFLYSVVMFNAWVMINAMMSATSKQAGKNAKHMTQTHLRIEIITVLARHEPRYKTPPDIGSLCSY